MALEGWELIGTGAGIVVGNATLTVVIVRGLLNSAVKAIKHHCGMQKAFCDQEKAEMKDMLKTHGHKALDANGGRVVL